MKKKLTIVLEFEDSGEVPGWFARVEELPGCMSQDVSIGLALAAILDAMKDWLSIASVDFGDKEHGMWKWLRKEL